MKGFTKVYANPVSPMLGLALNSTSSFTPMLLPDSVDESPPFQPYIDAAVQDYVERKVRWIAPGLKNTALFYQFRALDGGGTDGGGDASGGGGTSAAGHTVNILPDACMNFLFECDPEDPRAIVSGVFLEPKELTLKAGTEYFGFKPYSSLSIHSDVVAFTELVDGSIGFLEAFPKGEGLLQQLAEADGLDARIELFNAFAGRFMVRPGNAPGFVDYLSLVLCRSGGTMRLGQVSQATGYSERYCRKRFKEAFGCSPKRYGSIMRFQSALKSLTQSTGGDCASTAFDSGFFDQAHFIHEFSRYARLTPGRFLKEIHPPGHQP
jgi:AraC-like DNA-binding protein